MKKKRITRSVAAFAMVVEVGSLLRPAHAAPECRGVSGVVQCWDERVRECIPT